MNKESKKPQQRQTERMLQNRIVHCLERDGWVVLQTFYGSSRGGSVWMTKGMPDLIAVKAGRVVFIEVKRPGGRLSPAQKELHERLRAAGAMVLVLRSLEGCKDMLDKGDEV